MIQGAAGVTTAFEASSATSVSRTVQGVHERIENDDGHVEQVWAFPTRPAGSITVRVEVEGYAYADETEAGLRFVDSDSGVSVRYGHATWIDARGSRMSVKASWSGRSIELVLDGRLLAASLFPATLDPIIVVELEPNAPVLVPDVRGQGTASVATSATTSLARRRRARRARARACYAHLRARKARTRQAEAQRAGTCHRRRKLRCARSPRRVRAHDESCLARTAAPAT